MKSPVKYSQEYSLGIDFGTSGTRCCVIDHAKQVIAESRISHSASGVAGTCHEQDPEQWWQEMLAVIKELPATVRHQITRISIDGTSSSVLLCDLQGRPQTAALMYNDSRAATAAQKIQQIAPKNSAAHGASSSLSKLLWLFQHNDTTAGLALHQADWIANRLCKHFGISDYNNSLKMGYDPVSLSWPDWISRCGIPTHLLPKVTAPGTPLGQVDQDLAQTLGLPSACIVTSGTTDSIAAFLATGANTLGTAVTSLGSTLVVKLLSDHPIFAPEYGIYSHRLGKLWLPGGASNSGGNAILEFFTPAEIKQVSLKIDASKHSGLAYYPLVGKGERFPVNDPEMTAQLSPVPENNPALLLHGLFEGIANIEKCGYALLQQLGAPAIKNIITVGGGAANPVWRNIRNRIIGCEVSTAENSEAAYGAALLAAQSLYSSNPETRHL